MKTVYVAGRSGGHIIPACTIAQNRHALGDEIYFVALDRELDRSLLAQHSWITQSTFLALDTIRPFMLSAYFSYAQQWVSALRASWDLISTWQPDEIVSMGGYISLPICYVAWMRGIPIHIYELNAEIGTAVYLTAPLATQIYCCFPEAEQACKRFFSWTSWLRTAPIISTVPYPIRYIPAQKLSRDEACIRLGLESNWPILLILGGSQGSRSLNSIIISWLLSLPEHERRRIQVIHQTGSDSYDFVREQYTQLHVPGVVFAYRDDLATCYSAADCAVSRAGAGAIHELSWFGIRTLLVPLRTKTTEHQYRNAFVAIQRNRAWAMADGDSQRDYILQWLTQAVREGQ